MMNRIEQSKWWDYKWAYRGIRNSGTPNTTAKPDHKGETREAKLQETSMFWNLSFSDFNSLSELHHSGKWASKGVEHASCKRHNLRDITYQAILSEAATLKCPVLSEICQWAELTSTSLVLPKITEETDKCSETSGAWKLRRPFWKYLLP